MLSVTAASGQLGALVIEALLSSGVPAGEIVAAVRNPGKADGLAARGVQVREADYGEPETLATALADTDRLLLISTSPPPRRPCSRARATRTPSTSWAATSRTPCHS